ncbi:hypothetical protein JYB87_07780 [Shewanella avicenniae]|uniref:HlyD family secretion protein n=1 Tax=Shewanella avicenniae TaxID=2814294 RepID=A0ABX7QUC4_9GAMM|nr:hypothetical protein [Shewanella avicenniae]QSX35102.1 hypothetical protein JYB87_07780 [Shewanella avicenniae]
MAVLTKLLVTLLVVVIGWKVINKRQTSTSIQSAKAASSLSNNKYTLVAGLLLVVAAAIVGWQWWVGFQQVSVTIVSPRDGKVETYLVRKRDISENKIVTVDGLIIRLSQEERIEITP